MFKEECLLEAERNAGEVQVYENISATSPAVQETVNSIAQEQQMLQTVIQEKSVDKSMQSCCEESKLGSSEHISIN